MQTTNFLPGMNPYLQARWPDAHTRLIAYVGDALGERLPRDLSVMAEEAISIDCEDELDIRMRADVAIVGQSGIRFPDSVPTRQDDSTIALAQPETIYVSQTHRWLEIRDVNDHLVTVIELLSPSNKTAGGAVKLAQRHERLVRSGVNTVVIDLIRGGVRSLPEMMSAELRDTGAQTMYLIIVGKAHCPDERQIYYCPLRERLPAFAVPLRATDTPVALDLQPLVDRCYQSGRYWQVSQRPLPQPSLPADERTWVDQQRAAAGLVDSSQNA